VANASLKKYHHSYGYIFHLFLLGSFAVQNNSSTVLNPGDDTLLEKIRESDTRALENIPF
jgi:hypothetical protein